MLIKKVTSFLTMTFTSFLILFFILTHLLIYAVAGEGQYFPVVGLAITRRLLYIFTPSLSVGYLVVVLIILISLIIALVWIIKLIKAKSKAIDYLQPFIFLFTIALTLIVVSFRVALQTLYQVEATRFIVFYIVATSLYILAYGIHLMVFGLFKFSVKEETIETALVAPDQGEQKVLTEHEIRMIIKEELKHLEKVVVKEVITKQVVKEEPVKEAKPPVQEKAKTVPVKEEIVQETVEPVADVEDNVDKKEIDFERIPFVDRIANFEQELLDKYQELKDYILKYDVKSRLSSSGDSFRAKRVMYFKITNSGNSGFKVYFRLDMQSYANTTYPLKDASGIKMYEEVPAFMYLKSDLSLKRAKELVDDVMLTNGFEKRD